MDALLEAVDFKLKLHVNVPKDHVVIEVGIHEVGLEVDMVVMVAEDMAVADDMIARLEEEIIVQDEEAEVHLEEEVPLQEDEVIVVVLLQEEEMTAEVL